MKLLFATLLCHRDCEMFKFNWFASRINLDRGFDIPHLVLNDGSLTVQDIESLRQLPNVIVESDPVKLASVPKAVYLAKLEGFAVGFEKYGAQRVVVMDSDVFFYRNWDADLRKICMSPAIALRDWGSSLGPHEMEYRQLYGVFEDATTPNCNTGVCSIPIEQYPKLRKAWNKYLETKVVLMEDQGAFFGAFYGQLEYINGIKCFVMGGEKIPELLDWMLQQNACHLMGMRVRPEGLSSMIAASIRSFRDLNLDQFSPAFKQISWGLLEHGTYDFTKRFQYYPSSYQSRYITNAMYMHGGSRVWWRIPPQFTEFTAHVVCLDTGIRNTLPIDINGVSFTMGDKVKVPLNGELRIITQDAPGSHLAFLNPMVHIGTSPILNFQAPKME